MTCLVCIEYLQHYPSEDSKLGVSKVDQSRHSCQLLWWTAEPAVSLRLRWSEAQSWMGTPPRCWGFVGLSSPKAHIHIAHRLMKEGKGIWEAGKKEEETLKRKKETGDGRVKKGLKTGEERIKGAPGEELKQRWKTIERRGELERGE